MTHSAFGFSNSKTSFRFVKTKGKGWKLIPLCFLGLVLAAGLAAAKESKNPKGKAKTTHRIAWRSPAEGLKESLQTKKPILYDITAEWCGPCHRLTSTVFENPACAKRINQLFIPVRVLDRQREEGKNPPDIGAIEEKYELQGFPTLVVQFPGRTDSQKLVGYYGREGTMDFLNKAVK